MSFNVKFQEANLTFYHRGLKNAKNLRCETLFTADYEDIRIYSFAVLDTNLWLEEDGGLHTDNPLYSFKFIQSKDQND